MNTNNTEWLAVSTEGFAQQNAARPSEHLVKELLQNGLDSLGDNGGVIELTCAAGEAPGTTLLQCRDNGCGIENMDNLRTVFWTSKQDSHLKRGRMGRGFKELLCLCLFCEVSSRKVSALFTITPDGERTFSIVENAEATIGTVITMIMPWEPIGTARVMEQYFATFLPPDGVSISINGNPITRNAPKHLVPATLTTEAFQNGRWVKPNTKTTVELVPASGEGLIYEMGIPVCPVEWDVPYHANILQRVPMNPNRDAVMSGYAAKIHKACLPILLAELDSEAARSAWVGEAASKSDDGDLQKEVLGKAFGKNLARSVPSFGKFSHDADAEKIAGSKILDTRQLSGGFRELVKVHVPTSREVAETAQREAVEEAAAKAVDLFNPDDGASEIIARYGRMHIENVCAFHHWLANKILASLFPGEVKSCSVRVSMLAAKRAKATWSTFSVFTLALDYPVIWESPLNQENFAIHIHETAHELAFHHGNSFADAMQTTAGLACAIIVDHPQEIEAWRRKLSFPQERVLAA